MQLFSKGSAGSMQVVARKGTNVKPKNREHLVPHLTYVRSSHEQGINLNIQIVLGLSQYQKPCKLEVKVNTKQLKLPGKDAQPSHSSSQSITTQILGLASYETRVGKYI